MNKLLLLLTLATAYSAPVWQSDPLSSRAQLTSPTNTTRVYAIHPVGDSMSTYQLDLSWTNLVKINQGTLPPAAAGLTLNSTDGRIPARGDSITLTNSSLANSGTNITADGNIFLNGQLRSGTNFSAYSNVSRNGYGFLATSDRNVDGVGVTRLVLDATDGIAYNSLAYIDARSQNSASSQNSFIQIGAYTNSGPTAVIWEIKTDQTIRTNSAVTMTSNGVVMFKVNYDGSLRLTGTTNIVSVSGGALRLDGNPIAGVPGGSDLELQFNDAGAFGGASGITTDASRTNLTVSGLTTSTYGFRGAFFEGTGTTADSYMYLPDDDASHHLTVQANNTTTTDVNIIGPAAPFSGLLKSTVSGTTNMTLSVAVAGVDYGVVGTLINPVPTASVSGQIPQFSDTTGTNVVPSSANAVMFDGTQATRTVTMNLSGTDVVWTYGSGSASLGTADLTAGTLTMGTGSSLSLSMGETGQILRIAKGTLLSPDSVTNPLVKVERVMNLTYGSVFGDGAPNAAAIVGITAGTINNGVQTVGLYGAAYNLATNTSTGASDSVGVYGAALNVTNTPGVVMGLFGVGTRASTTGKAGAAQLLTFNYAGASAYNPAIFPETSGIAMGASGNDVSVGIFLSNPSGAQYLYGIGFGSVSAGGKVGAVSLADIRTDDDAITFALVNGRHSYGTDYKGGTFTNAPIRLPNNKWIVARNASDTADINIVSVDSGLHSVNLGGLSNTVIHAGAAARAFVSAATFSPVTANAMQNGAAGFEWQNTTSYGFASVATNAAVTIASTGWTNTFGRNASVYMDGVSLVYTVYNNAGTAVYTNGVATANANVLLQTAGKVIITSGTLGVGRATPL